MTNVGVVGAAGSVMLVREHSGLLADHDLRGLSDLTALASDFEFGGSAPPDHRRADSGPDGLRISVGPHAPSGWEGFFAVTRIDFPAMAVFHVAMTRDTVEIPRTDQSGEAVFAVQTASTKRTGILNYVLAASSTNDGQTGWLVGHAKGLHANAELTVLWECAPEPSVGAKVSQDITLRTDGRSTLQVWFGTQLVYAVREGLHLEVDPPCSRTWRYRLWKSATRVLSPISGWRRTMWSSCTVSSLEIRPPSPDRTGDTVAGRPRRAVR